MATRRCAGSSRPAPRPPASTPDPEQPGRVACAERMLAELGGEARRAGRSVGARRRARRRPWWADAGRAGRAGPARALTLGPLTLGYFAFGASVYGTLTRVVPAMPRLGRFHFRACLGDAAPRPPLRSAWPAFGSVATPLMAPDWSESRLTTSEPPSFRVTDEALLVARLHLLQMAADDHADCVLAVRARADLRVLQRALQRLGVVTRVGFPLGVRDQRDREDVQIVRRLVVPDVVRRRVHDVEQGAPSTATAEIGSYVSFSVHLGHWPIALDRLLGVLRRDVGGVEPDRVVRLHVAQATHRSFGGTRCADHLERLLPIGP